MSFMDNQETKTCLIGHADPAGAVAAAGAAGAAEPGGPALAPVRRLRTSVRVLERVFARMLADQTTCCGISLPQCHVLLELEGAGCVNLNALANRLDLDKSTMSRTVDSLVRQGLVNRSADPANRRQQIICLSAAGLDRVAGMNRSCDAQYRLVLDRLPVQEQDQVLGSLEILARALQGSPAAAGTPADTEEAGHGCCL